MSRRARIGIIVAIIGLLLVVAGVFVISNVIRRSLAPPPPPTPLPPLTENVVVTTRDIPLGGVLQPVDVTEIEIPVDALPREFMRDMEQVVGRITKIPLISGELVMPHHLADPTNVSRDLAFVIGDEQVLMAFHSKDLMSTLDILQRGDVVDILVSIAQDVPVTDADRTLAEGEEETKTEIFTFDALQRVEVSAVVVDIIETTARSTTVRVPGAQGTPEPTPTPQPAQVTTLAYLLALAPQDALILKHLKDDGAIFDLVLRAPTSTQFFELDPVMSEYLIDRYELEVTR